MATVAASRLKQPSALGVRPRPPSSERAASRGAQSAAGSEGGASHATQGQGAVGRGAARGGVSSSLLRPTAATIAGRAPPRQAAASAALVAGKPKPMAGAAARAAAGARGASPAPGVAPAAPAAAAGAVSAAAPAAERLQASNKLAHPSRESSELDREEAELTALVASRRWHAPDRPSKKYDALKTSNPFSKAKSETGFSFAYQQGTIPCRINHGVVVSRLQWDEDPAGLDYDPLLVTVAEGLRETKHPFVFVAQTAFKEMLLAPGARDKASPLVPQVVRNLRAAMLVPEEGPFAAALCAVKQLSECVGPALDAHMGALLIQINKKSFEAKFKTPIFETLLAMAENGGPDAARQIKLKVPCFSQR
jgi:hypothetical protein